MATDSVSTTTVSNADPVTGTRATRTTTTRSSALGDFFVSKTNQVIFSVVAIIDLLITLRLFFLLLGANRVGLVNFILNLTEIFVAPARGIFPSPSTGTGGYLEAASIVSLVMWIVFGYILSLIISLFSTRDEDTTVV
jgi:hypothetical protein